MFVNAEITSYVSISFNPQELTVVAKQKIEGRSKISINGGE
jgi:hypothetical protein